MTKEESRFYDNYEKTLLEGLMKVCSSAGLMDGTLLGSEDLDGKWESIIKDYIADAVLQFNDYPEATIAWPAFIGMAVACMWDNDWEVFKDLPYASLYGEHGFDDMDEHILRDIMKIPLDSEEASKIVDAMDSCALAALALIRHEGVEAQTAQGFFILARTYTVMFKIGVSTALKRMKYKFEKIG